MTTKTMFRPDDNGGWATLALFRPDGDGGWGPVTGSTTAPAPPFVADTGPLRNIATNCGVLQNQWTPGTTGAASATRHQLHANADSITIGYYARPNPGFGAKASTPLRAWVRPQGGTWQSLTFSGVAEVTLNGVATAAELLPTHGQNIYSDPVPGTWRFGDVIEVLTWGQAAEGTMGVQGHLAGGYDLGKITGGQATVSTAPDSGFSASGTGTRPSAVVAPSPQEASWALIGDSNSVNPTQSYMSLAFRARSQPHILNGKHGLATYHLNDGWWDFQLGEQVQYCDSIFSALGTNDGNKVGGDLRQEMVDAWTLAQSEGVVRWVQATIPPRALDSGGMTGLQATLNPWLRDGAPVQGGLAVAPGTTGAGVSRCTVITAAGTKITGTGNHPMGTGWVCDTASAMETTVGSHIYRQDVTPPIHNPGDLTHYPQAGHDIQVPILTRDLALMGF